MVADVKLGLVLPDVADEVQHPQPARLEEFRMGLDHLEQSKSSCMFQQADRQHLVVLAVNVAEVGLARVQAVPEAATRDLLAQPVYLCSVVVFSPVARTP